MIEYSQKQKRRSDMQEQQQNNNFRKNIILGKNTCVALDANTTENNLNSIVIGGSGFGKSLHVIEPNLLQANSSYVITDPGGYLYEKYGSYLQYMGYHIKCLNLVDPNKSDHYNPLAYIRSESDIKTLVDALIKSTSLPSDDDFFTGCEYFLLCALIGYLRYHAKKKEQNFSNVIRLILALMPNEKDISKQSAVDELFEAVRKENPDDFSVKQYDRLIFSAGRTLKFILVSAAVRLKDFTLDEVKHMTDLDDLYLEKMPDEKTALFVIVPQTDNHLMFLASLLCHQICQMNLEYCRDTAAFTQIVKDEEGEVVKVFRAKSRKDMAHTQQAAKKWLAKAKNAQIRECSDFSDLWETDNGENKTSKQYVIKTDDEDGRTVFGFRGSRELAETTLEKLKAGQVVSNAAARCPIQIQFLLSDFARIPYIPDFPFLICALQGSGMSVMMGIQNVEQLEQVYGKRWRELADNCDICIYLGGGTTRKTFLWLSERLRLSGSRTKKIGSMPRSKCMIHVRGRQPVVVEKYPTMEHPEWQIASGLATYSFKREKEAEAALRAISATRKNNTITLERRTDASSHE